MKDPKFSTSLFDSAAANVTNSTSTREFNHRRFGWNRGSWVRLADQTSWRLPQFTEGLLLTTPQLLDDLHKAVKIAERVQSEADGSKEQTLIFLHYHAQMANIGLSLLKSNYELPEEAWKHLLKFKDLPEMLSFTTMISGEIESALALWVPFISTHEGSIQGELLLN